MKLPCVSAILIKVCRCDWSLSVEKIGIALDPVQIGVVTNLMPKKQLRIVLVISLKFLGQSKGLEPFDKLSQLQFLRVDMH